MSREPSPDDILSAIKQSGYLIEQEVASELETLGFRVKTNQPFLDPDSQKSREIDVLGFKRISESPDGKLKFVAEVICECKNSTAPIVFLKRRKNGLDLRRAVEQLYFPKKSYVTKREVGSSGKANEYHDNPFVAFNLHDKHYATKERMKYVQFARIIRNGKKVWTADHAGLYDNLLYPISKAVGANEEKVINFLSSTSPCHLYYVIPIIVTTSLLYEIDTHAASLEPKEIDFAYFTRGFNSSNLKGDYSVTFVQRNKLRKFFEESLSPIISATQLLVNNRSDEILSGRLAGT